MKIKIKNESGFSLPAYATIKSAGLDLRSTLGETTLKAGERMLIPTGLFIQLPDGYEAQIRPRSGLAFKHGLTVLNSPGTIDADYTGEIKVILINTSNEDFTFVHGDRICQMVITNYVQAEWEEVSELEDTERGSGGFGHSGNK